MSEPFETFASRFGRAANSFAWSGGEDIHVPAGVSEPLRRLWALHGFGSYGDGLIWTPRPSTFADLLPEWTGLSSDRAVVIARFSFGDFAFWFDHRLFFVNVHRGHLEELPGDPEFLFDEMLCDDVFLDDFLRRQLHEVCTDRLGQVAQDECFGFVPALALGGTEHLDKVRKVKLREHLAMLARINGPLPLD